jgi:glycosyltransferase involved in cell wall biosynthesis
MYQVSVIICTHNPRIEYLNKVLEALKAQTLAVEKWELILVDNGSKTPLSDVIDLSWHPGGRCVRENDLGLTPARIRGIVESQSELLLFVDDDNCLYKDYLDIIVDRMGNNPLLGVLGAGKIIPVYETEPSAEVKPYVGWLALRDNNRPFYSNEISFNGAIPLGAGLCIRKVFALKYVEASKQRLLSASLDRTGNALLSGGDVDMALYVCKDGYLAGTIPELGMTHLIPSSRLHPDYIVRLMAGHAFSLYILGKSWGYLNEYEENGVAKQLRYWKKLLSKKGLSKKVFLAQEKALAEAREAWRKTSESVKV